MATATATAIKGRKSGSSESRTPVEQPDDLQSIAKAKLLLALGEGEFDGGLTGQTIFVDGTPIENADGSSNVSGVYWEFRPGNQAQSYIQGLPGTENEINVGTEIHSATAWAHTYTNTQLSAVRVRLKWPSLFKQEDNGDLVGNSVKYAIDLQTDGGAFKTVVDTAVTGKTTSGYERSHRISLPQAGTSWTLRVRKLSADANSAKIGDTMTIQSYTEVIDAKLRYPNTALLYIEFDSSQFNGSIPQIACEPKGRVIRVPDNYDPITRSYSGTWSGAFKWAWTDNPAWVFYDLVITERFGLGNRLTAANIDKWELYRVAQYCDQLVPDGKGGSGTEPRYKCDVYVQSRNEAYTVLRDFAAIFRGMTYWGGNQIVALADMPRDVDYNYTRANVIDGLFNYSSSTAKTRYTTALVSWSDPDNAYADAMEPVFEQDLVARYGFNQLELTAIGCIRQSEANRKGRWGILTNNKDRVVTFGVGLDGMIPQPGYIIGVADELLSGKVTGGRIRSVNGRVITLDRKPDAVAGDRLQLNLPSGASQSRTIQSVKGNAITVSTAYSETPAAESVWIVESDTLYAQQYRVVSVADNNDNTFTISAAYHDPDKYARIDTGAIIDQRPISVVPAGSQSAPANIQISTFDVVSQGINVQTLRVTWDEAASAISYEAQWRRNEGNWINVPRSATTSFEVSGIYAGRYVVRVRAINAAEISSGWAFSEEKALTGKVGNPPKPVGFRAAPMVFGVELTWGFTAGAGDTLKTEIQYSEKSDGSDAMLLADVPYPQLSYRQQGLKAGIRFWYRAQLVDKTGNESGYTDWIEGQSSSDAEEILSYLTGQINDTQLSQDLLSEIDSKAVKAEVDSAIDEARSQATQQVSDAKAQATREVEAARQLAEKQVNDAKAQATQQVDAARQNAAELVSQASAQADRQIEQARSDAQQAAEQARKEAIATANTGIAQEAADRASAVQAEANARADALLNEKNERTADISTVKTLIQNGDDSLAQQISQIAAGSGEQFDSLKIWYFDTGNEGWTEDDSSKIPLQVTADGWLLAANSPTSSMRSPVDLGIDAAAYRFLKLRVKKVGAPSWRGRLWWIGTGEQGWSFGNRTVDVAEPEYDASGVATVTFHDVGWISSGTIRRFRFDLAIQQDSDNYFLADWIAVGRPTPGAGMAALQDEATARVNADAAEATQRNTLAVQLRGAYDGTDASKVSAGLIFSESQARITGDKAEATARQSLETKVDGSISGINKSLDTLNTRQTAQASDITSLKSGLNGKADATALQSLQNTVKDQGDTVSSQGASITSLKNGLDAANGEIGKKANASALDSLQNTVTQQGQDISSQSGRVTSLENSLTAGNAVLNGDFAADVSQWASSGSGSSFAWDSDSQALVSGRGSVRVANSTLIRVEAGQIVTLSFRTKNTADFTSGAADTVGFIAALSSPTNWALKSDAWLSSKADEWETRSLTFRVPDDATYSGLYVRFAAGTLAPASARVYIDDVMVVVSDGLSELSAGVSANAGAIDTLNSAVKQQGDSISSVSGRTTTLENGLKTTNANVDKKADASAVQNLQNTVKQQGDTLSSQGSSITGLQNSLKTTNANVDKKADSSALDTLKSTVTEQGGTLTSQGNRVTSLENGLKTTNASVDKKADASAVQALQNTVKDQGDKLTSQGSSITSLQNGLATTNGEIGKKADASALDSLKSTVTQQGGRIDSQSDRVTALENSVSSGNLLANGDFSSGTDGWAASGTGSTFAWDADNQALISGPGSVRVANTTRIPVVAGQSLTVSFRTKNTADFRTSAQKGVGLISSLNDPFGWVVNNSNWVSAKADEWETRTYTFEIPKDATFTGVYLRFAIGTLTPGTAQVLIDDVVVTSGIAGVVAANSAAIDTLTSTVTQQGESIGSISDRTTTLENGLKTTSANVDKKADASAVQNLQNTVKQQGDTLSSQGSSITGLQNSLKTTNANVDKKADSSALDTLKSTVTEQGGTLTSQGNRVTSLENGLKTTNASVDKKADASAVQALQNTVKDQGDKLTSQGSSITSLQNGLATTNGEIGKKADASALNSLQNTVTQQGQDISSQSGRVTSLENSITTGNAIINGDFSADVSQWASSGSGSSFAWDSDNKALVSGGGSVRVANSTLIRVEAGQTVTLSFRTKNTADFTSGVADTVGFIADLGSPTIWAQKTDAWLSSKANVWETRSLTFKVPDNAAYTGLYLRFAAGTLNPKSARVYIDDVMVVVSNGISELSAGVSASAGAIDALSNTVKQQGDSISSVAGRTTTLENGLKTTNASVDKKADASAVQSLQNTVKDQGDTLTSQSGSITELRNNLSSVSGEVSKKADASAVSSLQNTVTQQGKDITSQANSLTQLASSVGGNTSAITSLSETLSDMSGSVATQVSDISASNHNNAEASLFQTVNGVLADASISSLSKVVANNELSSAQRLDTLTAQLNDAKAQVQTNASAITTAAGRVDASYTIKLGVNSDGTYYGAGMGIGLSNETGSIQSQVLFTADRFGILPSSGGGVVSSATAPFVVEGGQVFMNSAVIKDGFITNAMIGSYIQSTNYSASAKTGWNLSKNGLLTMFGNGGSSGYVQLDQDGLAVYNGNKLAVVIGKKR